MRGKYGPIIPDYFARRNQRELHPIAGGGFSTDEFYSDA
jgi:hypothetical protein